MAQTEIAFRSTALKALRAKGIDFCVVAVDSIYVDILPAQDEWEPMRIALPDELSGRTVRALWRAYKIPIHWFWNPLMIPGDEDENPPC